MILSRFVFIAAWRLLGGMCVAVALLGCNSTSEVTPAGKDTFAISVKGYESNNDTPEGLREKMMALFQAKAQQITEGRHYDRFELVSFEVTRQTQGGASVPIGRGTIHCFR